MKIFGREPALILGFVYSAISLLGAFVFHLSGNEQGALNIVAAALMAVVIAWFASRDGLAGALLQLAKGVMAGVIAFGAHLSPEAQAIVMVFVANAIAVFTRQAVTAPISQDGKPVA